MLRCLIVSSVLAATASAAIWPERLGPYERKSDKPLEIRGDDRPEWDEYGLEAIEQADYGAFRVTADRFKDTTGAYGASLEPSGRSYQRVGNYLILCSGNCPKNLATLADTGLPNVSRTELPVLASYLPVKGRISRSQRYVLGPVYLKESAPGIPETAVGLQFSPEAALARYKTPKGEQLLAIFSYPTPQIARDQAAAFEKAGLGAIKRTGPYVAVIPAPFDPAAAAKLLDQINYQASVAENEPILIPIKPKTAAQMILAIFTLAGIVLVFCVLSGFAFGAFRVLSKRFGYSNATGSMIVLDLRDK